MIRRPDGGWLAHNIYYIGRSGIINFRGLKIGGISGIYSKFKFHTLRMGKEDHYYRLEDVEKLLRLHHQFRPVDVFISHDWPQNIIFYGSMQDILKVKPFLRHEVSMGDFGSPPLYKLLHNLKPRHWFSAHMHVYFRAIYGPTQFVALNKNSRHGGWMHVRLLTNLFI